MKAFFLVLGVVSVCVTAYGQQQHDMIDSSNRRLSIISPLRVASDTDVQTASVEKDSEGECGNRISETYFAILSDADQKERFKSLKNLPQSNQFIVFDVGYSAKRVLGYSDKSRLAYIHDVGVDPLDLSTSEVNPETEQWLQWRINRVQNFVSQASALLKARSIKTRFLCDSSWLTGTWKTRLSTAQDWPSWTKAGLVDEIILEGEWDKPDNKKLVALARDALAGTKVKLSVALDTRRDGKSLDPLTQLLNLQGERFDEVYVKVDDNADLPRAQEFVKNVLPQFQFGLANDAPASTLPAVPAKP